MPSVTFKYCFLNRFYEKPVVTESSKSDLVTVDAHGGQ